MSKPKGRPIDPTSYYTLLNHYNEHKRERKRAEKTQCECGKILFLTQLEAHKKTKLHEQLLRYKQLAEEGKNLLDFEKTDPPAQTQPETLDCLLLKVATDPTYRKKVKEFLNMLEPSSLR